MKKQISVCIPTYNQAHYLKKAVLSAFNQTLKPFEIIVSNDCSTDNTTEVLTALAAEVPILKVIHQSTNVGIATNTDQCLRSATGEYVVRLDSDDYLLTDYIKVVSSYLDKFPEAGYAHAAVQEIDADDNPTRVRRLFRKPGFCSGDEALRAAIYGYKVAANIIMFRREALVKVQYLKGCPDFGEDYYMTAAISAAGYGNVYIDQILCCYRVWVDGKKVRLRRKFNEITGLRKVFEDVLTPAFISRNWDLKKLERQRANFAASHASCLAMDVYSKEEKLTLAKAVAGLSSAPKAKYVTWMYLNNCGSLLKIVNTFQGTAKSIIKKTLTSTVYRKSS
ncbi:glycosyltransferase family 2 protein [Flavisolibacter sp. BT320]|nr:glycosyltransferase family 2 protein [Flavisolibacter longurius]